MIGFEFESPYPVGPGDALPYSLVLGGCIGGKGSIEVRAEVAEVGGDRYGGFKSGPYFGGEFLSCQSWFVRHMYEFYHYERILYIEVLAI